MSFSLTEFIGLVARMDTMLSASARTDDAIVSITLDPSAFDLVAQARYGAGGVMKGHNRLELAGIIVRKDHGLTDTTQPEIKKRAG